MKNARKRRVVSILLIIILGTLVASLWGAIHSTIRAAAVDYAVPTIQPDADEYCPGDVVTYDVDVQVTHFPAVVQITESWCDKGVTGRCSAALSRTWNQVILEPRHITGKAARRLPVDPFFIPGDVYQMYHATIDGDLEWYILDNIRIGETCP